MAKWEGREGKHQDRTWQSLPQALFRAGAKVLLLQSFEREGPWIKITDRGNNIGWVQREYCRVRSKEQHFHETLVLPRWKTHSNCLCQIFMLSILPQILVLLVTLPA